MVMIAAGCCRGACAKHLFDWLGGWHNRLYNGQSDKHRFGFAPAFCSEKALPSTRGADSFSCSHPPHDQTASHMISPELLLQGYRLGVFPMGMTDGTIEWFSPDPRAILPLDKFHVPHVLRRKLEKGVFEIRINQRFGEVIRACAKREDTWITREIMNSYERLHELGWAHSVETWRDGKLAGGLYGVAIGGAFFGESMFHRVTDASKVALAALVAQLRARKFVLLDTQWVTPHLKQFGVIEISRAHYLRILARAVELQRKFV